MTIRMGAGGAVVVESGALLSSKTYVSSFCEQKVKINMNITTNNTNPYSYRKKSFSKTINIFVIKIQILARILSKLRGLSLQSH